MRCLLQLTRYSACISMIGVVGVGVAVVAVNYGGCHYVLMWNVGALIFLMFVGVVCFFKSASMMWMIVVVEVTKNHSSRKGRW